MISICIPIYNYYAYPLVRRLSNQIASLGKKEEVEIVCIDDHSSGYYLNQNMGICDIATYLRLSENIGRARIRNLFLKYAKGDWLLFLDNDSLLPSSFLKNYLPYLTPENAVVVGGRIYDSRGDDAQHRLRYLYGVRVESRSAADRAKHPYRSFMTNNFIIRRTALESIRFDSRISSYGHEDTLFGYRLEQNGIPILHVDNPVVNGDIETNAEFLHKTIEGVQSLVDIYGFMWEDQRFCHSVRLLDAYGKIRRWKLQGVVYRVYAFFKSAMENHFVSGKAISLRQFSFYKLGTFIQKMHYTDVVETTNIINI